MVSNIENFTAEGKFWVPSAPNFSVIGTLVFEAKRHLKLTIILNHDEPSDSIFKYFDLKKDENSIILGYLVEKQVKITLVDCYAAGMENKFSLGYERYKFKASYCIYDEHYHTKESINIRSMWTKYTNLNEWGLNPYDNIIQTKTNFQPNENKVFEISLPKVEPIKAFIESQNLNITLKMDFTSQGSQFKRNVDHNLYVKFESNILKNVEYYRKLSLNFSRMLALLTGRAVFTEKILLENSKKSNSYSNLLFCDTYYSHQKISHHKMIAPLSMIVDNFEEVCIRWLSRNELQKNAQDLLLSTYYNQNTYINHSFLSLIQALETFHRTEFEGKYASEKQYKSTKDKLTSAIPNNLEKSFKDSLKSRIKYGNEYSLRKRMADVLKYIDSDLKKKFVGNNTKEINKFINNIVDTRNYYTHYTKELSKLSLKGSEVVYACTQLKWILIASFYKSLSINISSVHQFLDRNPGLDYSFKYLREQAGSIKIPTYQIFFYDNQWLILKLNKNYKHIKKFKHKKDAVDFSLEPSSDKHPVISKQFDKNKKFLTSTFRKFSELTYNQYIHTRTITWVPKEKEWLVELVESNILIEAKETKKLAIQIAKEYAKANSPVCLEIHKKNHQLQKTITYKK